MRARRILCIWRRDSICRPSKSCCVSEASNSMTLPQSSMISSESLLLRHHPNADLSPQVEVRRRPRLPKPNPNNRPLQRLHARINRQVLLPPHHHLARQHLGNQLSRSSSHSHRLLPRLSRLHSRVRHWMFEENQHCHNSTRFHDQQVHLVQSPLQWSCVLRI
jgi:hypothetical protein